MSENETADIAWLKGLAEEGARSPVQGGSILLAAGLIYGSASLIHWALVADIVTLPAVAFSVVWGVAVLAFFAALILLIGRLKRQGRTQTAANRAFGIVWAGLGWGIFALFLSMIAVDLVRTGEASLAQLSLLIPSIIMSYYGVGWAVTATMMKDRMMWLLAFGSFAAAPILGVLSGTVNQYLAYGLAMYVLMALPGWFLMRKAARG